MLLKWCGGRLGLYTCLLSADAHGAANMFAVPLLLPDAPTLDTGILSGTVQHKQPGQRHCSASANIAAQAVLMLQERAKQAKQAATQAELAELKAVLHTKQAIAQALLTSHMRAQVWQSCFVA